MIIDVHAHLTDEVFDNSLLEEEAISIEDQINEKLFNDINFESEITRMSIKTDFLFHFCNNFIRNSTIT